MKAMINPPVSAFFKTFQSHLLQRISPTLATGGRSGKLRGLCVALGLALAQPVGAQIIYQTDFSGGAGTLPASWTTTVSSGGGIALNGAGQLVYSASESGVGMAYWTGNSGAILNGVIGDAKVSSMVQWPTQNNDQSIGILGRVQNTASLSQTGYFVGLFRTGSINYLIIGKDPSGSTFGSILSQVQVSLTVGNSYLLESTFSGNDLSVSLFAAAGGASLADLATTYTTYSTGFFGVRGRARAADRHFIFDNYTIAAVPEPSSLAILAGAGAIAFALNRRRRAGSR